LPRGEWLKISVSRATGGSPEHREGERNDEGLQYVVRLYS